MAGRIVIEARRWIGTPYVAGASNCRGGCDCVGYVAGVWDRVHGMPPGRLPRAAQDAAFHDWRTAAKATVQIASRWPHVAIRHPGIFDVRAGDVLLVRVGRGGSGSRAGGGHVGISLGESRVAHAMPGLGVTVAGIGSFTQLIRIYRPLD